MGRFNLVLIWSLCLSLCMFSTPTSAQLKTNFYSNICPNVESIVKNAVTKKFQQTFVTVPATILLFFHDCFVQLPQVEVTAEKDHPDNLSLAGDGFDTVIKAKAAVDAVSQCKNKVSCADILALATRDAIVLAGGPSYQVELGRLDGLSSTSSSVNGKLPQSTFNVNQLNSLFAAKGLSQADMVALSEREAAPYTMVSLGSEVDQKQQSDVSPPKELDAGALFVLKSQGSWLHVGYHLTTSIVAPALLSLPFAMASLGWVGGVVCVALAALVTFYSYTLLSLVLEHQEHLGHRQLRFRDMARDILGPAWGKYLVGPLQFWICYGAVIACTLLGGQSLKFIYLLANPNGTMKLYQFITMFGCATLFLAQMPSFHSLRHINLVSLFLCLVYSSCVTAGCIYIGHTDNAPVKDYSLKGTSTQDRYFGVFNGISIIATTYASGIIPEIQATLAPPVKGKMFKGLCMCYGVILTTYFSVAMSGYWAFGNKAMGTILYNFMGANGKPLLPTWFLLITNVFTLLQVLAVTVVYLQPTNEVFEKKFADPKMDQFSTRNVVPRLILRSVSVVVATFFAAMLPFFGDIMALFGAFGCIPLDFILPMIFYNVSFKPSKQSLIFWVNTTIAGVSFLLVGVGSVASVRQIILDAKTFRLFANM